MKTGLLRRRLLIAVLASGVAGCASRVAFAPEAPSVAIAIVMADGGVPSRQQVANIQVAMRAELARNGYVLAADPRAADYVVHVRYTPDLLGGSAGRIAILDIDAKSGQRNETALASERLKTNAERAIRDLTTEPP